MNDRRADFDALRAFAHQGDQQAFATLARRHLDLVYATAFRKVSDAGAAQEISQTVFTMLARKAWLFGPDDSLPAWLHRTTLLEAKQWWRGELRRRRREETAAQLGTTMKTPDDQPALHALVPLLDEALLSLRESDRTALLLRYFESRPLRDVGESLGVKEDAAQKRVAGALEQLTRFFQRRGYKTVTGVATAAVLQQTTNAAPAVVVASVVQTALHTAPPTFGVLGVLARLASLSKAQTAAVCLAVAAVPVAWQCNTITTTRQQIVDVQSRIVFTQAQQHDLTVKIQNLQPETARLQAALADHQQTEIQRAEVQRRLLALKDRIRALLNDPNYHWPADLPFVRIPKSAVAAIGLSSPLLPPGVVPVGTRELLGLSPEERQAMENAANHYFTQLDERMSARVYETNHTSLTMAAIPAGVKDSTVLVIPPLGSDIGQAADQLFADLASTLGPDRTKIVEGATNSWGQGQLRNILALDAGQRPQEIALWIEDVDSNNPVPHAGWSWADEQRGISTGNDLTNMLSAGGQPVKFDYFSEKMNARVLQWFADHAASYLNASTKP